MGKIVPAVTIDLATLVFVQHQDGGALFIDGDGDYVLFTASGNRYDLEAAIRELQKAVKPNQPKGEGF